MAQDPKELARTLYKSANLLKDRGEWEAALIESMDLVISVDTSITHLASALGKSTWLLLSFNSDARWMMDRADSPWYPALRVYRQQTPKDWPAVLERVAADLRAR